MSKQPLVKTIVFPSYLSLSAIPFSTDRLTIFVFTCETPFVRSD